MKILLIRHAKSIDDTSGVSQRNDTPLSAHGTYQTRNKQATVETLDIQARYSSDYRRATETAQLLFPAQSVGIRQDIHEVIRPAHLNGGSHAAAVHFWEVEHKIDKYDPDWTEDGYESFTTVAHRARTFLDDIRKSHQPTDTIAVVTHGGFIRHCIGVACMGAAYRPEDFFDLLLPLQIDNLDIIELTLENDKKPSWRKLS